MMSRQSGLAQYQQVQVDAKAEDASPHRLIQMLMEGGLQRMAEAKGAIQREDMLEKGHAIGKAGAIMMGLRSSLNMEAGGELARNMDAMYEFIIHRLTEANLANDCSAIDDCCQVLRTIKEGWDGIAAEVN
jgi:flagellar protein FliS